MTDVLLATCARLPLGEPGGHLLVEELSARGITASWACWDDPAVAWADARLVAVRSTWDYDGRRDHFLAWAREVEAGTPMLHPARVLSWNTDKRYLLDLAAADLPVVPTLGAEDEGELPPAVASFGRAVVKPRVGAGGRGVVVFDGVPGGPPGLDESRLTPGPWVVQPLVDSVRTEGETSVFVFDGRVTTSVRKVPDEGELRVHERYGGASGAAEVTADAAELALAAVARAEELLGLGLSYGRVDLMRLEDGTLAVSEIEVTEPGLYLDVVPRNAASYAQVVAGLLDR